MLKYFVLFFILISTSSYAQKTSVSNSVLKQKLIIDENLSDAVYLHPNPVNEYLKIKSQGFTITKIEIFSILGGKLKEINPKIKSIYLGDLPRGIYLIKIYSKKGYTVKKLIKK